MEANAALDPAGRHAVLELEHRSKHPDQSETTPDSSAQMCVPLVWRSHQTPSHLLPLTLQIIGVLTVFRLAYPPLS